MKCAVAILLAMIGMVVCNPVPSGYGYGAPLLYPSAVSMSSSYINHGLPVVKIPVVKVIPSWPAWGGYGAGRGLGHGF